ncbi:MAG: hypothetical protein AVDCRST_MAG88-1000, partial [uncultured Thermomicrobiales bacterium]
GAHGAQGGTGTGGAGPISRNELRAARTEPGRGVGAGARDPAHRHRGLPPQWERDAARRGLRDTHRQRDGTRRRAAGRRADRDDPDERPFPRAGQRRAGHLQGHDGASHAPDGDGGGQGLRRGRQSRGDGDRRLPHLRAAGQADHV